jgi:anti-sigma regulatory factor (Ser/Thr protein kinase)
MNESHSIRIGNSMAEVASALDEAANWIEPLQVSAKAQYFLSLAIEELATNWIKYGCRDSGAHVMTFDLGVREGRLTLTATDDGLPFNPMLQRPRRAFLSRNAIPEGWAFFSCEKWPMK